MGPPTCRAQSVFCAQAPCAHPLIVYCSWCVVFGVLEVRCLPWHALRVEVFLAAEIWFCTVANSGRLVCCGLW